MKLLITGFFLIFLFLFSSPTFAAISFSISNPQYQGEEITVDVSLSGLTSSSCSGSCYLQGALTSTTANKYFGFTKNNSGNWYEYIGSPDTSYIQSTFFSFPFQATWSGKLTLKTNSDDPDYNGPGSYNLKVWRYTGKSTSYAGTSNTLLVSVTGPATPTPTPTPSTAENSSPSPSQDTIVSTDSPIDTSTPDLIDESSGPVFSPIATSISVKLSDDLNSSDSTKSSTLSAKKKSFQTPKVEVLGTSENIMPKILVVLGIVFIISSGAIFLITYKKQNG